MTSERDDALRLLTDLLIMQKTFSDYCVQSKILDCLVVSLTNRPVIDADVIYDLLAINRGVQDFAASQELKDKFLLLLDKHKMPMLMRDTLPKTLYGDGKSSLRVSESQSERVHTDCQTPQRQ